MVMATLYGSVEDAFLDLHSFSGSTHESARLPSQKIRGASFWHGEIWPHYLACRGNLSALAERLQIDRNYPGKAMADRGLPCLHGVDNLPKWRALVRFSEGASLSDACLESGAKPSDVMDLLRVSIAPVVVAVKVAKKTSARRAQPNTGINKNNKTNNPSLKKKLDRHVNAFES